MKLKRPIVLYFTADMVPTEKELEDGTEANARFRNASLHAGEVEKCDFVMGSVPEAYAHVPRYGEEELEEFDHTAGEQVGDCYLHQVRRGEWSVYDEEGSLLNEGTLTKSKARALAMEHTEE